MPLRRSQEDAAGMRQAVWVRRGDKADVGGQARTECRRVDGKVRGRSGCRRVGRVATGRSMTAGRESRDERGACPRSCGTAKDTPTSECGRGAGRPSPYGARLAVARLHGAGRRVMRGRAYAALRHRGPAAAVPARQGRRRRVACERPCFNDARPGAPLKTSARGGRTRRPVRTTPPAAPPPGTTAGCRTRLSCRSVCTWWISASRLARVSWAPPRPPPRPGPARRASR